MWGKLVLLLRRSDWWWWKPQAASAAPTPGPITVELVSHGIRYEVASRMSVDVATRKRVEFVAN